MASKSEKDKVSIFKLRLGVFLFILWWIPIYLTFPYLDNTLNASTKQQKAIIGASIIIVQTILGVIGVFLVGKALAATLRKVEVKKLPITVWRILWSGKTDVDPSYFKTKKDKKPEPIAGEENKNAVNSTTSDLVSMLKSKEYMKLLVIAAVLGIPISALAYFFLQLINHIQTWVYISLPQL